MMMSVFFFIGAVFSLAEGYTLTIPIKNVYEEVTGADKKIYARLDNNLFGLPS